MVYRVFLRRSVEGWGGCSYMCHPLLKFDAVYMIVESTMTYVISCLKLGQKYCLVCDGPMARGRCIDRTEPRHEVSPRKYLIKCEGKHSITTLSLLECLNTYLFLRSYGWQQMYDLTFCHIYRGYITQVFCLVILDCDYSIIGYGGTHTWYWI